MNAEALRIISAAIAQAIWREIVERPGPEGLDKAASSRRDGEGRLVLERAKRKPGAEVSER